MILVDALFAVLISTAQAEPVPAMLASGQAIVKLNVPPTSRSRTLRGDGAERSGDSVEPGAIEVPTKKPR